MHALQWVHPTRSEVVPCISYSRLDSSPSSLIVSPGVTPTPSPSLTISSAATATPNAAPIQPADISAFASGISANAQSLEQQNTCSLWAPLDAKYITAMMQLARCQNISVASFWYQNELFAYLDCASASMLTPQAAQGAIAQARAQAALAGSVMRRR